MSLARHAKSAVLWSAGLTVFREVFLRLGTVLIFRRLLETADYGIFSFVNSLLGFLAMFAFNNFVAYTVQVREEKDVHWQEHFTAGAFFQIPLFFVANLVAFALRWSPKYAAVAPYIHAMSVLFLLDWGCEFRRKMLERSFNWPRLRGLSAFGMFVGFLVSLNLALAGKGAYALLLPVLMFSPPFIYDLFITARWRPTWAWSWVKYRAAWRFGLVRTASGLAIRGRGLVESAAVVAFLGFSQLGILSGAVGLASMSCQLFTEQLLNSIYPVLTRVNPDPQNIARVNGLLLRFIAWVIIPTAVLASMLAGPFLLIFYGSKWTETIPLLPWAMFLGVAAAFNHAATTLLLAQQKLRHCLYADVALLLAVLVAIGVALPLGLTQYLLAAGLCQLLVFALLLFWLVRLGILTGGGFFSAVLPALTGAGLALLACKLVMWQTGRPAVGFWSAAAYGLLFGLVYLAFLRIFVARQLRELMAYVPARKYLNFLLALGEN
jgi:O-antigen/teichoic acid export membrane protein